MGGGTALAAPSPSSATAHFYSHMCKQSWRLVLGIDVLECQMYEVHVQDGSQL